MNFLISGKVYHYLAPVCGRGALNERKCTCTKEKRENERHELCNTKLWGAVAVGICEKCSNKDRLADSHCTLQEITNNIHPYDFTTHFAAFFV